LQTLIITIHIIACIALVILVLLQSGKEGMGVIFGGGGGSLFGSSGAGGLLSKLTAGAAVVFFCTSLTFTYMSAKKHTARKASIVLDAPITEEPAVPAETNKVPVENEQNSGKNTGQSAQ
jgi:preprotein translocase subunit SecG